ncbi:hypothetical protein D3C76_1413470 [compost metagenome]
MPAFQFASRRPPLRQLDQQPQARASAIALQQLRVMEVEALLHQRIERLEQALLDGESQGDALGLLHGREALEALQFGVGEDLFRQAQGAVGGQGLFQVQAQAVPLPAVGHQCGGQAVAVADGAGDAGRPDRRAVFT